MRPPQLSPPRPQRKPVLPVSGTAVPPARTIASPPIRPVALNDSNGFSVSLWVLYALIFMHFGRVFDRFLTGWHIPGILCTVGIVTVLLLGGIRQLKFAPGIALTCLVVWMTISAPLSIWRVASISYVFSYIIYWFPLMILVACVPRSSRDLVWISGVSVAASFFQITGGAEIDGRLGGSATFGNPDDFALLSGFAIPFMVLIAQRIQNLFLSFAVMGVGVGLLAITMFRTATRAVVPALILMLVVYFFNSKAIQKVGLLMAVGISAVAMTFVLPQNVMDRLATIFDSFDSQRVQSMAMENEAMASTGARKELLADAIKMTLDNPLLGVGPGEFADYRRENLTFAGGRDTIIHSISCIIGYFGQHPEALEYLRQDPRRIVHAGEEFFRVFMPLTHIGRVCPVDTEVHGVTVKAGDRVSLGWASANFDETVFEAPEEVRLDRKPNPHISFGFGAHLCLGAPHARLIVRSLLQALVERVATVTVLEAREHVEKEARYERSVGYDALTVRFTPRGA